MLKARILVFLGLLIFFTSICFTALGCGGGNDTGGNGKSAATEATDNGDNGDGENGDGGNGGEAEHPTGDADDSAEHPG